jgi:hypothetical protein
MAKVSWYLNVSGLLHDSLKSFWRKPTQFKIFASLLVNADPLVDLEVVKRQIKNCSPTGDTFFS